MDGHDDLTGLKSRIEQMIASGEKPSLYDLLGRLNVIRERHAAEIYGDGRIDDGD